jgi:NitT/TauT family transport system permease protein
VSAVGLALYCVFVVIAIIFHWNALGALFDIDQAVFLDQTEEGSPIGLLQNALTISTVFEYLAIAAVVLLWQPWARLAVYRRTAQKQIAALVVAVLVLVAWEVLIVIFQIQQFLLPRPSVIAATFAEVYPRLISAGWLTFQNAFWGFAVGCGAGILTGMVSARFVSFSKAMLPIAIGINAIPIIALAPIFNNWFGALSPTSKIAIVVVLVYFPAMISTVRGLTSVDPLSLELMRSYAASNWAIFRKLRLHNALPYIFSALKVGTTLSMIGSIVSEYFGGSTAGLGYRIRDDAGLFKYPEAWSAILVASLFGILFYLVVSAVERALLAWHVSFREK